MSESSSRNRLIELSVRDLGIIDNAHIVFGDGLSALTGETGAGKTLLVGAISLLLGARADQGVVRSGATEAVVEARLLVEGVETVVSRVVPSSGRSRAYIDGRMATAGAVAEIVGQVIELHGQHDHQALLSPGVQRDSLDSYGSIDLRELSLAKAEVKRLELQMAELGGDEGEREREKDLLRYQLDELAEASLADPLEDDELRELEDLLNDSAAHRESAANALNYLVLDGGAVDQVASAAAAIDGRSPFAQHEKRLRSLLAELTDLGAELRHVGDAIEDDPKRQSEVRARRQLLVELRRKYAKAPLPGSLQRGDGTLGAVIAYREAVARRIEEIDSHDAIAERVHRELAAARDELDRVEHEVGELRRKAAPQLAKAVQQRLRTLAMESARVQVSVGATDPGDDVRFMLAPNRGSDFGALSKIASGGELSRAMLSLRLVLSTNPQVLVFDEVDAGIGGKAAVAVGEALSSLASDNQVLVVTHLPQVAAFADSHLNVIKQDSGSRTSSEVSVLEDDARVEEIARMLAGSAQSERMREAAAELLSTSRQARHQRSRRSSNGNGPL